jgi:hypothetical protein
MVVGTLLSPPGSSWSKPVSEGNRPRAGEAAANALIHWRAAMFGLKGLGQARKPKVVLDRTLSGTILHFEFSGANLVLPCAL